VLYAFRMRPFLATVALANFLPHYAPVTRFTTPFAIEFSGQ
jgi:hypothetical protein